MAAQVGVNTYISQADADIYFNDSLLRTSWTAISSSDRGRALITAARRIVIILQSSCKLPIAPADIPADLANANAELALAMATNAAVITAVDTSSNLRRARAGSAEVEFFRPVRGSKFPITVMELLQSSGCLATSGSNRISGHSIATGTSDNSSFNNFDCTYGTVEGYP